MHTVAQTLLDITFSSTAGAQRALNVVHPRPVSWDSIIEAVNDALVKEGVVVARLEVVQFSVWFEMLEARASEGSSTDRIGDIVCFRKHSFYLLAETDGVSFFC